jgi:hypothetical protein
MTIFSFIFLYAIAVSFVHTIFKEELEYEYHMALFWPIAGTLLVTVLCGEWLGNKFKKLFLKQTEQKPKCKCYRNIYK